jgi:tetratricopeptide (TPR) repeat protein
VYQEGAVPRYRLLESIREYAQERLRESGEETEGRLRHREFFRTWVAVQAERITTEEQTVAYCDIEADYENVRRAMEWSEARGDIEAALDLAKSLARYWYDRGLLSEARRWLRNALTHSEVEESLRAKTLNNAAIFAMLQGDLTEAQDIYEESLRLYIVLDDTKQVAACYNNLGLLAHARQDYAGMEHHHQQSLFIYRRLDDTPGMIATLSNLGLLSLETGAFAQARERFEEALELTRPTGDDVRMATILQNLGTAALRLKDYSFARTCLSECITLQCAAGTENTISAANALIELARLALHEADYEGAVRRAGASQAIWDRLGGQPPESHQNEFEDLLLELRGHLDKSAYETLWSQGLALTLAEIAMLEQ